MTFIFRPTIEYAMHTRKRCFDIARRMKGHVMHQVFDSFLLRVIRQKKRGDRVIADVIDLPGDIYVAAIQRPWWVSGNPGPDFFHPNWHPGYLIEGEAGDHYGPNMTYAVTDEAQYEAMALRKYLRPNAWIPVPTASWSDSGASSVVRSQQSGTWPTFSQARTESFQLPNQVVTFVGDGSVNVYRLMPGVKREDSNWLAFNAVDQTQLESGLGWRMLTVDMAHLLDLPPFTNSPVSTASCYGDKVVYVVYVADARPSVSQAEPPYLSPESSLLAVGRVDLAPGERPEDPPTGVVTLLGRMSGRDLLPEDAPQVLSDVELPPGVSDWRITGLTGDYNTVIAAAATEENGGWEAGLHVSTVGDSVEQTAFARDLFIDANWASVYAYVPPACVGLSDAVDVLFVGQSSRQVAPVSAMVRLQPDDVIVPMDINDLGGFDGLRALNHTYTYLVRFGAGASVRCIARHTAAVHDPALRNEPLVVFNPVLTYLDTDGEEEQSRFVCLRIQSDPVVRDRVNGAKSWNRVIAPTADGVTVVVISGDGSVVDLNLGSTYPVTYPVSINRQTPRNINSAFNSPYRRPGYGWGFQSPLADGGASSQLTNMSVAAACEYAPGMVAVIVAPKAGYGSESQTAKLAVFRISDGSKVAESEFDLPFTVVNGGADARGLAVQWSVTCVERGAVDDGGGLTRYARLLFTEQMHHGPSFMHTTADLESLNTVTVWGVGWGEHMTGPAYYLGSPIAPTKVGRSTGRSFLAGKPVNP